MIYNDNLNILQFCDGNNWMALGGSLSEIWDKAGSDIYYDTGNVGIGKTNPFYPLDVDGTVKTSGAVIIGSQPGCAAGDAGAIRYVGGAVPYEYCDGGGTWLPFKQPACGDDDTAGCYVDTTRSTSDPEFIAANIKDGVTILGVTGTYVDLSDKVPDPFNFVDQSDVALSTLTTSNVETITGIDASIPVSITGDGGPQFSINGGSWVTSGSLTNGETLQLRLMSDTAYSTMQSATVTVGSIDDQWDVTTLAADTIPDAFAFVDQSDVALSTLISSNTLTITGINSATPISITGNGGPQFSIDGGSWLTSGSIIAGQTVQLRLTSSALNSSIHTASLDIGGVTDQWDVTTEDAFICAGYAYQGYCYYMGGDNQSCDQVCSSRGGCNLAGTQNIGSAGTNVQCQNVLDNVNDPASGSVSTNAGGAAGCVNVTSVRLRQNGTTTCSYKWMLHSRACACNN